MGGKVDLINGEGSDREKLKALAGGEKKKEPEGVLLKGTNRAIAKVMDLAVYFQGQEDLRVRIRTGTVAVVDDIVEADDGDGKGVGDGVEEEEEQKDGEEVPETQIRRMAMLEVGVNLK